MLIDNRVGKGLAIQDSSNYSSVRLCDLCIIVIFVPVFFKKVISLLLPSSVLLCQDDIDLQCKKVYSLKEPLYSKAP